MSQTFTEDCFAAGNVALTDLQNMENNFLALKTMFSGSSAPANSTGGMPWFDTGNKLLKIRNSTNGAWIGILSASTAPRFWHYSNAAEDGWIVDSSVADRVIAVKGGSAAYNTSGGGGAGTWTITVGAEGAHTHSHVHQWYNSNSSATNHDQTYNSSGSLITIASNTSKSVGIYSIDKTSGAAAPLADSYTNANAQVGSTHTHTIANTWRPLAAVGTMQHLVL